MSAPGVWGKAVTCTECGAVVPVDLPEGIDVPEFFMPRFDPAIKDFVHPDRTVCGFHQGAAS